MRIALVRIIPVNGMIFTAIGARVIFVKRQLLKNKIWNRGVQDKSFNMLRTCKRRILTNDKDKDQSCNRQAIVYSIKCTDCQAIYIGETGRNLSTRLIEHKRATKNGDVGNHIPERN